MSLHFTRLCRCGCGASLDGMPSGQLWLPPHKPKQSRARSGRIVAEPPREPRKPKCLVCYDMPHARDPERITNSHGNGAPRAAGVVRDGAVVCPGCSQPYVAEKPAELRPLLRSSSGADTGVR